MKKINAFMIFCWVMFAGFQAIGQCSGNKGPNLLGARGTFSRPYIIPNTSAAPCNMSGTASYSPSENVGNALNGCNTSGEMLPCSGYRTHYTRQQEQHGDLPQSIQQPVDLEHHCCRIGKCQADHTKCQWPGST